MTCTDFGRHEQLARCGHGEPVMVAVAMDDGCSGRLCQECDRELGVKRWPGLAERIPGPVRGLDLLDLARALAAPGTGSRAGPPGSPR